MSNVGADQTAAGAWRRPAGPVADLRHLAGMVRQNHHPDHRVTRIRTHGDRMVAMGDGADSDCQTGPAPRPRLRVTAPRLYGRRMQPGGVLKESPAGCSVRPRAPADLDRSPITSRWSNCPREWFRGTHRRSSSTATGDETGGRLRPAWRPSRSAAGRGREATVWPRRPLRPLE